MSGSAAGAVLIAVVLVGVGCAVIVALMGGFSTPTYTTPNPTQRIETIAANDRSVTATPRVTPTRSPLIVSTSRPSSGSGTRCADGTYSTSTGRGTCSHHGGIAK